MWQLWPPGHRQKPICSHNAEIQGATGRYAQGMTNQQKTLNRQAERVSRQRQRLKLIEACITALYQYGPTRTTIDKVVAIADMSPGIVNFYFETKAALLIAALEHLAVEFEDCVLAPLEALRNAPVRALDRLIELYLDPALASARKVSVWYAFWGESSSRREYYTICGKRDLAFAALVRDLIGRLIRQTGLHHLDADAIALGLIGALEMMWQDIAFQDEAALDRDSARQRCRAYLRSVFPGSFLQPAPIRDAILSAPLAPAHYASAAVLETELASLFRPRWHFLACGGDMPNPGDYVACEAALGSWFGVRDIDGMVRAFRNLCLHRPHALVFDDAGHFEKAIRCDADFTQYGLDGVCLNDRNLDGLHPSPVAMIGDAVFVLPDPNAVAPLPAGESALDLTGLSPFGAWSLVDVDADWKVVVEHWADVYLNDMIGSRAFGARPVQKSFTMSGTGLGLVEHWHSDTEDCGETSYARLAAAVPESGIRLRVERHLIWPNLMIEVRPDGVTMRQVWPTGRGRSRIRTRRYCRTPQERSIRALSYLASRLERNWAASDQRILQSSQEAIMRGFAGQDRAPTGAGISAFWTWLRSQIHDTYALA